jgi:hypothetical protein
MSDAVENQLAGRDHNQPPLDELLTEETADLARRRDDLLASAERAPAVVEDETVSQKVADLVRLIAACRKAAETWRVGRKEPFLATERLIDAHGKRITDPLDRTKAVLEKRLTLYQRAKAEEERCRREAEARARAEEAERQRREAEAAAAAAQTEQELDTAVSAEELARQAAADAVKAQKAAEVKPAELSRTRGEFGSVASLRTEWVGDVVDREALDLDKLRPFIPLDALEKAIRGFVKAGGRELRGAHIYEHHHTVVR